MVLAGKMRRWGHGSVSLFFVLFFVYSGPELIRLGLN
jgi:hypothetical protein